MRLDRRLLEHVFITLPTMFGVAYFVLWACAPPAALPPAIPALPSPSPQLPTPAANGTPAVEQKPRYVTGEIGLGAMVGIDDEISGGALPSGGGWSWLSAHIETTNRASDLGVVVSGAVLAGEGAGSFGGYLRVMKKRPNQSMLGAELSAGFLWARVAVPYMRPIDARRWFYFSPGATLSLVSDVQLPVGMAIQTGMFGVVRVEAGIAARFADELFPAAYVALSGSLRFGRGVRAAQTKDVLDTAFPVEPPSIPLTPTTTPTSAPMSAPVAP